jgi:hypothetical protein
MSSISNASLTRPRDLVASGATVQQDRQDRTVTGPCRARLQCKNLRMLSIEAGLILE